jgi:hypothetical protein
MTISQYHQWEQGGRTFCKTVATKALRVVGGKRFDCHVMSHSLLLQLTPMDNPQRTITLFCWILDVSDRPFSVSIEEARTVDDLKEAIVQKKSATFANIEADQLTLWKVSGTFSFSQFMLIIPLQDVHLHQHHSED